MEHVQRLDDPSVDRTLQAKPVEKTVNGKTITTPFPSPADWRDQWIYFLMVDRFNKPGKYEGKDLNFEIIDDLSQLFPIIQRYIE